MNGQGTRMFFDDQLIYYVLYPLCVRVGTAASSQQPATARSRSHVEDFRLLPLLSCRVLAGWNLARRERVDLDSSPRRLHAWIHMIGGSDSIIGG